MNYLRECVYSLKRSSVRSMKTDIFVNHSGQAPGLVIPALLKEGFTVLALAMPVWGADQHYPSIGGVLIRSHENLFSFSERPYRFFLEPVAVALNYLLRTRHFESCYMMGLSGGGWTTTLYAALDPRIRMSFPVAGSVPNYLRIGTENLGDAEQDYLEFYKIANYLDLYVLGAVGPGRRQLQILNVYDDCCFYGTRYVEWETRVSEKATALGGAYDVFPDDSHHTHKVSAMALGKILEALRCE